MNAIINAALTHTRSVLTLLALIVIAGVYGFVTLPKERQPDISVPYVTVQVILPGVSPEDAERLILRPLENVLRSLEGLEEMVAVAQEGLAIVTLEFDVDMDPDNILEDVREKVDQVRAELPEDAEEPIVRQANVSDFPVLRVTLMGDVPERVLMRYARRTRDAIEAIPAVLEAPITGEREELLEIVVEPAKLESYGITQAELINAVTRNNRLVAAGALDTGRGRFAVKVPGLIEDARDLFDLPLRSSGQSVVTLSDVAEVRRTFKDPVGFARLNGKSAVTIEVKKRLGYNVIDLNREVRRVVRDESAGWPDGLAAEFTDDTSRQIESSLDQLFNSITNAILLVMVIVVGALGLRSGTLVGLAIPASYLFGFACLLIFGMTINSMVLFALLLSAGMLVDGAIVVVEYSDRKMAEGIPPREAYGLAAKRMAWPIISSTATTLAAFLPLMFWPGIMGKFMRYMPATLFIVLTGSLIIALVFLPALGAVIGRREVGNPQTLKALAADDETDVRSLGGITGSYARAISFLIRHPGKVILGAILVLVGFQGYYALHGNGVIFTPDVEPERANIYIQARGNLSVHEINRLVGEVEREVVGIDGIETVSATTRVMTRMTPFGPSSSAPRDTIGTLALHFEDWNERRPAQEIMDEIDRRTAKISGVIVSHSTEQRGPGGGKAIQLQLTSRDPQALDRAADRMRAILENRIEGLIDIDDTRPLPGIEWELEIDREQASRFGADITSVGSMALLVTQGIKLGEYRPDDADDEIDIRLRFPGDARTLDELDELRVATAQGQAPLSNFVVRRPKPQVPSVERVDGMRVISLSANPAPGVLANDKVIEIRRILDEEGLDPKVHVEFRGADEQQREATSFLGKAMVISLFLMAIILVTQFNSFYHSFLILTTVVMSTVGVTIGLIVTGSPFVVFMTGIGIVALAGIVVNNNIVLIDTYHYLLKRGYEPIEAIIQTGAQRLRPVFLTTVTTVCGLLPMSLQVTIDFATREITTGSPETGWWVPLSTAIIFGLTFSTLLTLVVTPCALALPHRKAARAAAGLVPIARKPLRRAAE